MNKKIEIIRIINNLMLVNVISLVMIAALRVPLSADLLIGNISLMLFVIISEAVQFLVQNFILFMAIHIAGMYGCYQLSILLVHSEYALFINTARILVMGVIIAIAVYCRLKETSAFYPGMFESLLFVGILVFCYLAEIDGVNPILMVGEMVWALLTMYYHNTLQVRGTLIPFKEQSRVPYEAIGNTNGLLMRISTIVLVVFMFICTLVDYGEAILKAIHGVIYRFFRWLSSLFHVEIEEAIPSQPEASGGGSLTDLLPEDYTDNTIWHTIWQVLFAIVAIAAGIAIVIFAIKGVKEFYKLFNKSAITIKDRLARDKVEYLNPFEKSSNMAAGSRKNNISLRTRLSNEGRVRAMFKKYIQKGSGYSDIKVSNTPSELENISAGRATKAYEIYEKARYSSIPITSDDIKAMKEVTH